MKNANNPKIYVGMSLYRIRGTLCSILVLGSTGGVLLGFVAGHFLEYAETPRFALMFPILFITFFSFMPETPYYLMKINCMEVIFRLAYFIT